MENHQTSAANITPEKLAIMKLKAGGFERDILSEPSSPTGRRQSFAFGSHSNDLRSSLTRRSSRQVSTSRRASTFLQSHRSKMSMELTSQAEGKFFALMDLMTTASREASSLKESWAMIIAERDALAREKEDLLVRVDEVTETLERQEAEYLHHGHEHGERKRHVEKLLLELSAALTAVSDHKKKMADRDHELERVRTELTDLRATVTRSHGDHDKTKAEVEALYAKLKACEVDRDSAKQDSHKHHGDLRSLLREHTDLKSKFEETSTKFESTRKEALSLTDRIKIFELERDESLHEKDRLQDELKRAKIRAEEASRELIALTERHDRVQRDHHKLKETVRTIETERDDYALSIENLRREVKAKTTGWEEADSRCADVTLKYDHIKREVVSVKEKLRDVEVERSELRDAVDRSREEHRLIIIERDQHKEDLDDERRKVVDGHRRITLLEESLRRAEQTVTDVKSEIYNLTERNKVLLREGDEHQGKHSRLTTEITELHDKLAIFQAEIRNLTHARDRAHSDLEAWKHKYEEITETITSYDDSSAEFEFEIESLRTLLREAREQKERAISARHTADRERDEALAKYEEKCREMERFEESASSVYHSHSRVGGGGGKTVSRTVSSGTTLHHHQGGKHEGHEHGHEHGNGGGMFNSP
ncbi:Nn.00g080840.m01.CDS01 [Neocucurbitaria sp. VM-36]